MIYATAGDKLRTGSIYLPILAHMLNQHNYAPMFAQMSRVYTHYAGNIIKISRMDTLRLYWFRSWWLMLRNITVGYYNFATNFIESYYQPLSWLMPPMIKHIAYSEHIILNNNLTLVEIVPRYNKFPKYDVMTFLIFFSFYTNRFISFDRLKVVWSTIRENSPRKSIGNSALSS